MQLFYCLGGPNGREILPVSNPMSWARWYETTMSSHQRVVGYDQLNGTIISTVFMGLNLAMSDPPVLFETLVREPGGDGSYLIGARYGDWAEAEAGHQRAVAMVRREQAEARA